MSVFHLHFWVGIRLIHRLFTVWAWLNRKPTKTFFFFLSCFLSPFSLWGGGELGVVQGLDTSNLPTLNFLKINLFSFGKWWVIFQEVSRKVPLHSAIKANQKRKSLEIVEGFCALYIHVYTFLRALCREGQDNTTSSSPFKAAHLSWQRKSQKPN